jgi:hypothetical protein
LRPGGQRRLPFFIVALLLALLVTAVDAPAQKRKKKPARDPQREAAARVAQAKEDVVTAATDYKASLAKLLVLQEEDVKLKAGIVERRKALGDQLVSKRELEEGERELAAAQAKVTETRRQMGEADSLIAEATAEKQLALMPPPRVGATVTSGVLIRYNGPARWALADAAKVQSYFLGQFHHALPVSAFGQTAVHTQLGFDHSSAIDVAVHPDSAEGQALMHYLRSQGIPFIAFRQAVAGSATGAHIHIGYPSHRIR